MSEIIRPGPTSIEPGSCPGGVVIHVYTATVPPALVIEQRIGPDDDVEHAATVAGELKNELAGNADSCLVAFDGDSGERYSSTAWIAAWL